ncbi:hypothetical protein GCM10025762_08210 [Haloechinothrix salitolerans]
MDDNHFRWVLAEHGSDLSGEVSQLLAPGGIARKRTQLYPCRREIPSHPRAVVLAGVDHVGVFAEEFGDRREFGDLGTGACDQGDSHRCLRSPVEVSSFTRAVSTRGNEDAQV